MARTQSARRLATVDVAADATVVDTNVAPEWLEAMRAITGLAEKPGTADEPKILAMRDYIAKTFPEQKSYCDGYVHDSIPWCGLAGAYCMAQAGLSGPFGRTDTQRWMWALGWADLSTNWGTKLDVPRLGCIVVLQRSGGGHITFYESTSGSNYMCRGGNQSDAVTLAPFPKSNVVGLYWPKAAGEPPGVVVPPTERRELSKGDTGADVVVLQKSLGVPADGDFGAVTDSAVRGFQSAAGLDVDGICGANTWAQIDILDKKMLKGSSGLSEELQQQIIEAAKSSKIQNYNWPNRGTAPVGYIPGMALSFGLAVKMLDAEDQAAWLMATAKAQPETDALAWYDKEFAALGMSNSTSGVNTLRHLFVLMIGLGMRESSGKYCEGRDMSATNTSADTAEAGLFQTSWNIRAASPNVLGELITEYWEDPNGFLPVFQESIYPKTTDLQNYGSGEGAKYQWLAKFCPLFAALTTGVGLRKLRKHWGPINTKAAEVRKEADNLLIAVQALVDAAPEPIEPPTPIEPPVTEVAEVVINITTKGKVRVVVNEVSVDESTTIQ